MLFYRNNRFYWEGVSFALPDGLFIQTSPEMCEENVLNLWTEDKKMHITIGVQEDTKGPETELRYIIRELECTANVGPEKIEMGGLRGVWAWHSSDPIDYAEYRLSLSGKGRKQTEFLLLFSTREKMPNLENVKKWVKAFDIRKDNAKR